MKLLRVHVISAKTCGGLLDGLDVWLRSPSTEYSTFDPLCLVGPNGSGKSQFLQVIAEILQCLCHVCSNKEERIEANPELLFELEYLVCPEGKQEPAHIRVSRQATSRGRPRFLVQQNGEGQWVNCDIASPTTRELLPRKVVGYTSGGNETLSLPFLISRSGYAEEVGQQALRPETRGTAIPDTRLMLIDYGTHLEVLVANLLLGNDVQRRALLEDAQLKDLRSYRCTVQLAHSAAPKAPKVAISARKGIQLTDELEQHIDNLRRCATCYDYDPNTETYTFDYWMNGETRLAFGSFWGSALELYTSLHKLAMLNDLAIPKKTRDRFRKDTEAQRFASRLPEPQDEDKVFRFERVQFVPSRGGEVVDYVSLSDGEHQLSQLLGTFSMLSFRNVVFLLDEPESHFNPEWRVRCISRILDLPTKDGLRRTGSSSSKAAEQECLLTTHSPFVPSDMAREKVFIFSKDGRKVTVRHPDIETYGTTFDTILDECFGVRPPISNVPLDEIKALMNSDNPEEIKAGMDRLGHSVEKVYLADHLRQLTNKGEA